MSNYLLIGYLLGMVAHVLIAAEQARENKTNDPDVRWAMGHPGGPAAMAFFSILLSPMWPLFALAALARWMGLPALLHATADRLRKYAEEDDH